MRFCDHKSLSMPTLRMTCEAKNQLRDILVNAGFAEDSLCPQSFNYTGPDTKLDVVSDNTVKWMVRVIME